VDLEHDDDLRTGARIAAMTTETEPTDLSYGMPELVTHALQPVFSCEPDVRGPDGAIFGWLLEPPGALIQFVKPVKGTTELASWLVGPAFAWLDAHCAGRSDLVFILDLQHMVGRSAAARSILLHSAKVLGSRFARVFVVPPSDYPPMYMKAFHASVAFVRLLGVQVTVAGSSRAVVERYGLRVAR
jgi:hypothetical protein